MTALLNKQIILGVTGGIAAYKSADLVRRLQDAGATVQVIMTRAATEFVTPLTFQALSGHPVHQDLLNEEAERAMGHIELARWADLILVAPASADFLARLCHGEAGDLLSTVCLASRAPIAVAPAMNQVMYENPATQDNLSLLAARNITVIAPAVGSQACGETGPGRMPEPLELVERVAALFHHQSLQGKRVVITAGPTREALDPVRFLSNHSSGKMGFALAQACVEAGAAVTLICGPVQLPSPPKVKRIDINSARELLAASEAAAEHCDIFIGAAAVADYRPASVADNKIKKTAANDELTLNLVKNPDIIASIAARDPKPFMVGFAAETQDVEHYARDKLLRKGLDLVIANDVSDAAIGFNSDDNAVTLVSHHGAEYFGARSKQQLARDLVARIAQSLSPGTAHSPE